MSDVKQVKVDNWGIYFLQRLKHFFNRTDYCDLTLQFQDNAQLKVHRLVLNACTEYFELLERTCEMYEDCLVMPDDLQADVVVPIVNFMYTGHLEFRVDLLERLYQTSQILNMPVLSKLLESHRMALKTSPHSYSAAKRFTKLSETTKVVKPTASNKRSYGKAFDNNVYKEKKVYHPLKSSDSGNTSHTYHSSSPISNKKLMLGDSRPTRYELPEELDQDNVFDNSFCNVSYTCKPLMVHPDNVKRYSSKRTGIFSEPSSSKKLLPGTSTVDIVECKRIPKESNIFDDNDADQVNDDIDIFQTSYNNDTVKNSSQLFDQILDDGPKVTIEAKDSKAASNLDHAKIISEVLKKYPHLVKSNKNIKLKILSTPSKSKKQIQKTAEVEDKPPKLKTEPDYTYETDVIDSQQAAKLIAMGAENTKGPWICLICGTPGKALHFTSYYKFRRHLVDIHNEKPVSNICEYCGLRSLKRNYLLHHLYSQHGVPPPPQYNFPKCNKCNYIALTEGLLVKHKMTHKESTNFRCNVCSAPFSTTKQLLQHIQATGHKYSAERKTNLQCIYCLKAFLRDANLYAHLKTYHKKEAKSDGVIEDSDEEKLPEVIPRTKIDNREGKYHPVKVEPSTSYDNEYDIGVQYQIQQGQDGDIQLTPTKPNVPTAQHKVISNMKQKILNPGFGSPKPVQKSKPNMKPQPESSSFFEINIPSSPPSASNAYNEEEIVLIDNTEYIMRNNQLIPRKLKSGSNEYIFSDMMAPATIQEVQPTSSIEYTNIHNTKIIEEAPSSMLLKKTTNISQPIQIVVSNEEEYKALMASNHPILFDNDDSSKTLTVLTTQHDTTMQSATIDLNDNQSRDMMIIQENFPINVTEAVPSDNSNIVVVYSHPVDDQSKQYQILTTGGIGSQFVESSAMITQNYETVTTTTPMTGTHELEPQENTTWQSNTQEVNGHQITVESHSELESVNINKNANIEPQTSNNLSDLQEVHLVHESEPNVTHQDDIIDTSNELNNVNPGLVSQIVDQDIVEECRSIPDTQNETDILRADVEQVTSEVSEPMETSHENECIAVLTNNANQATIIDVPMEIESMSDHIMPPAEHTVPTVEQMETAEMVELVPQEEQVVLEEQNALHDEVPSKDSSLVDSPSVPLENQLTEPESQVYDDIVQINNDTKRTSPTFVRATDETIQNLTSEWSEDEYETIHKDASVNEENMSTSKNVAPPLPQHLEETIENIRQEMQNQLSTPSTITDTQRVLQKINTAEEDSTLVDTLTSEPQHPVAETTAAAVQNDPQTQEKISSLLNDWEDNDSQEENHLDNSAVEKELVNDVTIEKIPKTDDIKNLVSDWDEEEENKTEE